MRELEAILHGFILALGLILPLGVQNVFIFTQGAMQPSLARALPATVTAAVCDTILIVLSVSGLSFLMLQVDGLRTLMMIGGIIFLVYMSVSIWRSSPTEKMEGAALPVKKQILFACSVSFLNPSALVDIVGVIGTSSLQYSGYELLLFTISCIAVSWLWFFALMLAGARIKHFSNQEKVMAIFNKSAAIFIFAMAIYLAVGLL